MNYYTSEKRKRSMELSAKGVLIGFIGMTVIIIVLFTVVRWENRNKVAMWVPYEVVYKDPTQVVLYNENNLKDSIVIRGEPRLFPGIQVVMIKKYRLP